MRVRSVKSLEDARKQLQRLAQRSTDDLSGKSSVGHDHDGSPESKLAQANTHESPDTDAGTTSLHHTLGTGANQAASGNDQRFGHAIATITSDPPLGASHGTVLCNAAGGAFAVTLPAASTCSGRRYRIKKIDSTTNAVTITPTGADTIDGAATLEIIIQYASVDVQSDGTSSWAIE